MSLLGKIKRLAFNFRLRYRVNHLGYRHKGVNVTLHNGSTLFPPEKIWLGNDIYIGPEAYLWADGGITIHDNVILGPRVSIFTANHKIEGADYLPYGYTTELGEVEIFSNSYIGAYSIILAGVRIGEGAIVAAGSVVTKNVPPLAFVAGNPAQVKRYRDPEHYLKLKQEGRFYVASRRGVPPPYQFVAREAKGGAIGHDPAALDDLAQHPMDPYKLEG